MIQLTAAVIYADSTSYLAYVAQLTFFRKAVLEDAIPGQNIFQTEFFWNVAFFKKY